VVFVDATYFSRWYCLLELRAALAAFAHLAGSAGSTPDQRMHALAPVVIVLPEAGASGLDPWNLPPEVQRVDWPTASDPVAVATLV